jgi:hypothetical protein
MNAKKIEIIREVVKDGSKWKSAYGYVLNEKGEIEKVHHGSNKREIYATEEEVKEC